MKLWLLAASGTMVAFGNFCPKSMFLCNRGTDYIGDSHLPANPTTSYEERFELLYISNSTKLLFLQHLVIPGFPQSNHTVSKLSADTGSL